MGLAGEIQDMIDIHYSAGVTAFVAESNQILQSGQVSLQIFTGAQTPAAGRRSCSDKGAHQIVHAFQIGVNHPVFNKVSAQAGGQPGQTGRRL